MEKTTQDKSSNQMTSWLKATAGSLAEPLLAIAAGLVVGGVIIFFTGESVAEVYAVMFKGGFSSFYYFLATLTRSVPIMLCGLGAMLAWRAGYFNIGGEGQLIVGGFITTVAALFLPFRGGLGIVIAMLAGSIAGGLYALLAAWLNERFGVILLISTLMFNYIAHYITFYFVAYPLKDTSVDGMSFKTVLIDQSLWLPRLGWIKGSTFHIGFFIALVMMCVVIFIVKKTTFGYESLMGGLNRDFARYGGVKQKKVMFLTMFGSGALCALGGAIEVTGLKHLYMHEMLKSPSYAWTGLMAALISNLNPLGTVVCAIFLAGIQTGGAALERNTNVPLDITLVIQSVITLLVSAKMLARLVARRRQTKLKRQVEGGAGA